MEYLLSSCSLLLLSLLLLVSLPHCCSNQLVPLSRSSFSILLLFTITLPLMHYPQLIHLLHTPYTPVLCARTYATTRTQGTQQRNPRNKLASKRKERGKSRRERSKERAQQQMIVRSLLYTRSSLTSQCTFSLSIKRNPTTSSLFNPSTSYYPTTTIHKFFSTSSPSSTSEPAQQEKKENGNGLRPGRARTSPGQVIVITSGKGTLK